MAGNDGSFWHFFHLQPFADSGEDPVPLSLSTVAAFGKMDQKALCSLQLNLWNGWMDKFRVANPTATAMALSTIPDLSLMWGSRHMRPARTKWSSQRFGVK